MKTRQQHKKAINSLLTANTQGIHSDDSWAPYYSNIKALSSAGYDVTTTKNEYKDYNEKHMPTCKQWLLEINHDDLKKPFYAVFNAHGAGTVEDPLCRYDISAYCC